MKLIVLTSKGIPVKRDLVPELVRRAGLDSDTAQRVTDAFTQLEQELDNYAQSLGPEWGE